MYLCHGGLELTAGGEGVAVDAQHARLRELPRHGLFKALGAEADHLQAVAAVAGGATQRHGLGAAAVVALQLAAGGVHGHHRVAGGAFAAPAASVAAQERRVAPAVQEQHHLSARCQRLAHGAYQFVRKAAAGFGAAHIEDTHGRQRHGCRPCRQAQMLPGARPGVLQGFQRRRCRTEQERHTRLPRPHHGEVAGVVTEAVLLFVSAVVFFINDDAAQVGKGREHRRTRADQHLRLARAHRQPVVEARAIGQRRMG